MKNKILIVDDKEDNRYLLRAMLQGNGYEVVTAGHGAEALDLARRNPPDLIIADVLMPILDGFALCREWKKDAQLNRIPFIFYTATYTDERDRDFGLRLGADAFIVKPEEPEALIAIVRKCIRKDGSPPATQARTAANTSGKEEHVFLKQYNEALIRKLEDKMADLARTNRALEQDIAERQRTEAQLRESQATYRSLFMNMMNSVVHARMIFRDGVPVDMEYISTNPAFAEVTGIQEPVVGRRISEVIPGYCANNPESIRLFGQVATTGLPTRWEHYLRELDRWFSFMIYSPARGELVIVTENITERKRAEETLLESEERFRALVNGAPDGIFVQGEGRFLFLNPAMARLLGAAGPEELLGTEIMARIAPEYRQAVLDRIRLQRETKNPVPPMEQEYLRLDGARVPVETVAVAFRFQGRDAHLVFIRDITSRRKAEMQRENLQTQLTQAQKMESVGRLAGGVAHDFNNMLGVILGHAEMALENIQPDHPLYADLVEILKATNRSADLTRQLLAFARKQTASPQTLDLNQTVEEILKMLQRLIGEDIDLAWRPAPDLWPVKMDPSQIDQILTNLCVNARHAIAGVGKITIETGTRTFDAAYCAQQVEVVPGEYVMIAVSDNGCGMDQETQSKLFEPFFTTKGVGQGTGLGLATVYGIVKQNNGFINVYSELGQGTTFQIYLPRHAARLEQIPAQGAAEPIARGRETVLLVEDEPAMLSMGRTMLERLGYQVLGAATPGEAIHLAEKHSGDIDLLMTDVVMPEMNGRELAKNLLSLYPDLKRLFMSGYTANVIAHHGVLHAGMDFIQKPFAMKNLSVKVRAVLDGR